MDNLQTVHHNLDCSALCIAMVEPLEREIESGREGGRRVGGREGGRREGRRKGGGGEDWMNVYTNSLISIRVYSRKTSKGHT